MTLALSDPRAPPPSPCIGSFDEEAISCSPMNEIRFNLCPPSNIDPSTPNTTSAMNENIDIDNCTVDSMDVSSSVASSNEVQTGSTISGKWTEEDTDNCDNMFLVESSLGETIFIFVKGSIIQEKDCITGDLLRSFDLNKLDYAQFLDDEEPRLKLLFNSSDSDKPEVIEVCYTFEDEESLSRFKDQFIAPFINEEYLGIPVGREIRPKGSLKTSSGPRLEETIGLISSRSTGFNFNDISINFFGTQISIPVLTKERSHFDSNPSSDSNKRGANWTEEDVENSEDMFLVENKESKTVFLFVKDNIIHEKDCVTGDVKVDHDLGVISNAIFPEAGSKSLEMKLFFDSRVQSKKEARYTFEDQESFDSFKKRFIQPSLTQRAKTLLQGRRRFECLKCGFSEVAGQMHEKDNSCPQCSSVFTFFTSDHK
ncbi:uncharacterized protein LOC107359904 isoform X1 [Tetranychus urticae]|uniref:Uncharacterized protein n=2 Tax=Tetranychus urticae TaxID=32264 RepID=T1K2B1_TETUR|nr:uncharacterized protein LOC107359904 isoform X1 [Tetranychus urticae]